MTCTIMNLHIFSLRLSQCLIRIFIFHRVAPRPGCRERPGLGPEFCFLNQTGPGWSWRECLRLLHVARLSKVKVSEKLQVVKKIIMSDSGKWFAVKANKRPTVHVLFVSSDDDVKARK